MTPSRSSQWIPALSTRSGKILIAVGGLIVLGIGFYGGRAYQNNADQSLFNQYNPPTTGAAGGTGFGGGGGFAGSGGGQNSLTRAALGAGSPPGTTSGSAGSGGSRSSTGGTTGSTPVVGVLTALTASRLTLQTFQGGSQTVTLTSRTVFYQTKSGTVNDLSPGDPVSVLAAPAGKALRASSITIGSPGVTAGGRFGGGRFGSGGTALTPIRGTVTSVGQGSIDISGTKQAIEVTGNTRINRIVPVRPAQVKTGSLLTVTLTTAGGSQVAATVVERNSTFRGGGSGSSGSGSGQ